MICCHVIQTQLYVSQGEAYLQLCDFQSAATCYKKAWILEPGSFRDRLAFIYYLQVRVPSALLWLRCIITVTCALQCAAIRTTLKNKA